MRDEDADSEPTEYQQRFTYQDHARTILNGRGLTKGGLPCVGKYPVRSWACAVCRDWHEALLCFYLSPVVPDIATVEPAPGGICKYCDAESDAPAYIAKTGDTEFARELSNYTPRALLAFLYPEVTPKD